MPVRALLFRVPALTVKGAFSHCRAAARLFLADAFRVELAVFGHNNHLFPSINLTALVYQKCAAGWPARKNQTFLVEKIEK